MSFTGNSRGARRAEGGLNSKARATVATRHRRTRHLGFNPLHDAHTGAALASRLENAFSTPQRGAVAASFVASTASGWLDAAALTTWSARALCTAILNRLKTRNQQRNIALR